MIHAGILVVVVVLWHRGHSRYTFLQCLHCHSSRIHPLVRVALQMLDIVGSPGWPNTLCRIEVRPGSGVLRSSTGMAHMSICAIAFLVVLCLRRLRSRQLCLGQLCLALLLLNLVDLLLTRLLLNGLPLMGQLLLRRVLYKMGSHESIGKVWLRGTWPRLLICSILSGVGRPLIRHRG